MEKGLAEVLMLAMVLSLAAWKGVDSRRSVAADEYDQLQRPSPMPSRDPVKTIQIEEGDVIDCVHIYAQPAFDHPLLKDHVIKIPKELQIKQGLRPQSHGADKKDEPQCPQGTIPILRLSKENHAFNILPSYTTNVNEFSNPQDDREFAAVRGECGDWKSGACGYLNVWNPQVQPNEYSASRLILLSGTSDGQLFLDHILAGWIVFPAKFSDSQTRFYTHWQANGTDGCFNLDCPGFVQVSPELVFGKPLPVSAYEGDQVQMLVCVFMGEDDNWWLLIDNVLAGYWPKSLFTYMGLSPNAAEWGGEILNTRAGGNRTTTQMGSGHPWFEEYGRAAFISGISCIDEQGDANDPVTVSSFVTNELCNQAGNYSNLKHQLFFGGTNDSSRCFWKPLIRDVDAPAGHGGHSRTGSTGFGHSICSTSLDN